MDALHVQGLGGWADLEMVSDYASLEDDDLRIARNLLAEADRRHSPD